MKKTYMKPETQTVSVLPMTMIAASNPDAVKSSGLDGDVTYGGVDADGTLDPASRRSHSVWDDEVEDEED